MVIQLNDGSQQLLTARRESPAAGAGDLGEQAAHVEPLEHPAQLVSLPRSQSRIGRLAVQLHAHVRIAEALQEVLAVQHRLQQADVFPPRRVESGMAPPTDHFRRPGDRVRHNWRMPNVAGKRAVRHVVYDTNFWKSFNHARLSVPMGDRGCLSLFGDSPDQHRLMTEHLTSEYRVKTEGRGRTVDEWKQRPERGDNHWFDCLVGCAVAASIQGAVLEGTGGPATSKRERVSFAEMQRRRRR